MTQEEKITRLKSVIEKLYCKEGKSKVYISDLLEINRKILTNKIKEWNFIQANVPKLTPSNQKFANKHKQEIINGFNSGKTIKQMAKDLGVGFDYLNNIINKTPELKKVKDNYKETIGHVKKEHQELLSFVELPDEQWKQIQYHEEYWISNKGRIKTYVKRYECYKLLTPYPNIKNNRLYIKIDDKNLQVSRLVGFAFVPGWSKKNNTIDHIDGDVQNNDASNLRWVSQAENNQYAYDNGRPSNKAYQKYGDFKKIIINDKYEFKTIISAAKFLGVSPTQFNRYYDDKNSNYNIKFIY